MTCASVRKAHQKYVRITITEEFCKDDTPIEKEIESLGLSVWLIRQNRRTVYYYLPPRDHMIRQQDRKKVPVFLQDT